MHAKIRESRLWQWLSDARLVFRKKLHMTRLENSIGSGNPDVEGFLRGKKQFWIELKTAAYPIRGGKVRTKVRDDQIRWHKRRTSAGQTTWILIQVGSGVKAHRYLFTGEYIERIRDGLTIPEMEKYCACRVTSPEEVIRFVAGDRAFPCKVSASRPPKGWRRSPQESV